MARKSLILALLTWLAGFLFLLKPTAGEAQTPRDMSWRAVETMKPPVSWIPGRTK